MVPRTPFFLFLLALAGPLAAQEPPAEFVRTSGQSMLSPDGKIRQAAYRSWDKFDTAAPTLHKKTLETALETHKQRLSRLCTGANPYKAHQLSAEELDTGRAALMKDIRTDWHKEEKEVKRMREEIKALIRIHLRTNKLAAADTRAFDTTFDATIAAMMEITRELEHFDEKAESRNLDDQSLRDDLIEWHPDARQIDAPRRRFQQTRKEITRLAAVEKANKAMGPWASGAMKTFATTLNAERTLVGLAPLTLDEKLSNAARGHSEDMVRLGFFAHESPVEGKKTPWDRAAKAGTSASGENIYAGSTNPQAAYDGWFASDGHRFIMFMDGAERLGVGICASTWTMMTGGK